MHIDILRRLWKLVRTKRPEKWITNSWFLLHDNAPPHRSALVKDFLIKSNVTTSIPHTLQTWLQLIFYLFALLKWVLKIRRFWETTDINKKATEELKPLAQNGFQECFQQLYSRWQKCTVAQRDYFEGNVAQMIERFCIFEK